MQSNMSEEEIEINLKLELTRKRREGSYQGNEPDEINNEKNALD